MATPSVTEDYYAILGLPQSAEEALIRSRYKQLALLKHPDRNRSPNAKAEFQLLHAAYSTLIDPFTRGAYDANDYPFIPTRPQPTNSPSNSYNDANPTNDTIRDCKQQLSQLDKTLTTLDIRKRNLDFKLFKARHALASTVASLASIDGDNARDRKILSKASNTSTAGWVASLLTLGLYSAATKLPQKEKEALQRRMTERSTGRIVRERERERYEEEVERLRGELESVDREIGAPTRRRSSVERMVGVEEGRVRARREEEEERKRKEDERKTRIEEEEERKRRIKAEDVKHEKELQEQFFREQAARTARKEEQLRRAEQEKTRKGEEEGKHAKQEPQPNAAAPSRTKEQRHRGTPNKKPTSDFPNTTNNTTNSNNTTKPTSSKQASPSPPTPTSTIPGCRHKAWWTLQEGSHPCSRCARVTTQFAFRCPSCGITACAPCRDSLKGKGKGAGDGGGW